MTLPPLNLSKPSGVHANTPPFGDWRTSHVESGQNRPHLKIPPSQAATRSGASLAYDKTNPSSPSISETYSEKTMHNRRTSLRRHFQNRTSNILPRVSTNEVTQGQASVLQSVYGPLKKGAQILAADAGTCERSARNHLAGANAMNLTDFFNACRAIPELRAWGEKMMGIEQRDADWHVEMAWLRQLVAKHGAEADG